MEDVSLPSAKMVVLFYEKPRDELYDDFTRAARDAGWDVGEREPADEPDGVRYRSQLRNGGISMAFPCIHLKVDPCSS
jgi:hypothetical protein